LHKKNKKLNALGHMVENNLPQFGAAGGNNNNDHFRNKKLEPNPTNNLNQNNKVKHERSFEDHDSTDEQK